MDLAEYIPVLPPNPTAEDYMREITYLQLPMEHVDPTSRAAMEQTMNNLIQGPEAVQGQMDVPQGWNTGQLPNSLDGYGITDNSMGAASYLSFPGSPAVEGAGSSASSYLDSNSAISSPADALQAASRKRSRTSLGESDYTDRKRVSNDASCVGTPGTPASYTFDPNGGAQAKGLDGRNDLYDADQRAGVNAFQAQMGLGFGHAPPLTQNQGRLAMALQTQPFQQHATPLQQTPFTYSNYNQSLNDPSNLHNPAVPSPPYIQEQFLQPNPTPMSQSGFAGQSDRKSTMKAEFDIQQLPIETQTVDLIDLTGDDDEFGSNAPANGQNDPFRELNFAFRPVVQNHQANSTQPVDAFNQEWMTKDELAQFLITPTPPSVDYVNDNFGQQPAINPSVNFSANFSANFPMAQPNLAEELFGRDDDESDRPMPYSAGEQPEALAKLIESIRPEDETPPELREPTPKAMSSELMEHQKLGLSWLKKMEEGHSRGGILADDMGLGKTIQALALILARPSEDPARKTTLIVAPVALMRQWEKEIERHVHPSHRLKVFVYHGSSGRNADFNRLRQYDVVLTTFGTLANEMKTKENRTEVTKELTAAEYPPIVRRSKDKLALIGSECVWYRVILDEAQCIKNRTTLTSKASNELQAQYRLCMTGTPMMNTVDELYPLLRFLQTKPYNDWARFSFDISKRIKDKQDWSKRIGLKRIQALLKSTMLRRTKDTIMDGEPICKIPPKHTGHQHVEFSDAESELYKALENQSVLKFNKYLRAGTVNNNYANVLVLLLRLRQACCHPHLIKDLGVQVSTEGISENELLDRAKMLAQEVVSRLREEEGFECPICFDGTENPTVFIPCGHTTCGECFQKLVDPARAIQEGNENRNAKCPHCRGPLNAKNITDYRHFCKVFCPEKLDESERSEDVGEDVGDSSDSDSDDEDEAEGDDLGGFVVPDDADDDYVGPASKVMRVEEATTEKKPGKGKGKAPAKPKQTLAQLKKESLRNAAAKRKYLRRLRKSWESSAKIEKTVELVTEIEKNDPTEKILIFSQFTSLLDLLEVPLQDRNFKYQRYDGSMKPNDRADAVYDFMENARTKIMLISLKAGNAGLNLNRASQVIILDPFWNPFIEDQAVDRAHRMRQEREVHVHRVLVPETVEDRICALQDRKREIINAALDENAGKSIARLGLRDLMFLFGSVDHL